MKSIVEDANGYVTTADEFASSDAALEDRLTEALPSYSAKIEKLFDGVVKIGQAYMLAKEGLDDLSSLSE